VENANDDDNDNLCECNDGYEESDGKCVEIVAEVPKPIVINVPADTFFNSGEDQISDENKQKLIADIIDTITEQAPDEDAATLLSSSCITITGYADRSGPYLKGEKSNQRLSERRAQTVANILKQKANDELQDGVNLRVSGRGHTDCTEALYPTPTDYAKCRRVDISINSGTCNGSTPDSGQTVQNAIDAVASVVSRPQS
jgi:flagellar motor protein MotB